MNRKLSALLVCLSIFSSLGMVGGAVRIDDLSDLPDDSSNPSVSVYEWVTEHSWLSSIGIITALVTTLYVFDAGFKEEAEKVSQEVMKKLAVLKSMFRLQKHTV